MATIGKLAVEVTADATGLSRGLATAGRSTDQFESRLDGLSNKLRILGPAAIAAGGAFAIGMIKSVANTADELAKLSARTGVAVEDLSRLQFAAGLSGVSNQALTASIERLSRGMADAAAGTGEAGKAFAAMGIEVQNQDGSLKSQRDVLEEVAERFASYADGAEKSALAQQIFGRSGAQLIPLLNSGARGLKDMADESDKLGNTISTNTAKAAERFNDNLTRMSTAAGGAARTISGPLIESLADLTDAMLLNIEKASEFESVFAGMFGSVVKESLIAASPMLRFLAILNEASDVAGNINFRGKGFVDPRTIKDQRSGAPQIATVGAASPASELMQQMDELDRLFLDAFSEREVLYLEGLEVRLDALRNTMLTETQLAEEKHSMDMELLREGLEEKMMTEQEFNEMKLQVEEELQDKLAAIREKAAKEDMQRAERAARFEIDTRTAVANATVGLLSQMGAKSKAAAVAAIALNKALSIAQIIQNTAVAQMRALAELGPIAGPAAAARIGMMGKVQAGIVAATGLMQAASVGGGGSSMTTSASPGAAASSGVTSGGTSATGRSQTVSINLQGEIFGREQVRGLITQINDALSDGAVLRLA